MQGCLVLDDTQLDYLLTLLGSSRPSAEAAASAKLCGEDPGPSSSAPLSAAPGPGSAGAAGPSGSGGAGPSSSAGHESVVVAPLVSQLKEVMGDTCGDGFLHACLHAYGYNLEEVRGAQGARAA